VTSDVAHYRCPTCGATKELRDPYGTKGGNFPAGVFCGWRGCQDTARRHDPAPCRWCNDEGIVTRLDGEIVGPCECVRS
jgi:hypothetical protein